MRFLTGEIIRVLFFFCFIPPMRSCLLALLGAKIGRECTIHRFCFINFYRGTFRNLSIGNETYIGNHVLFDLADRIDIGSQVTIAERVTLMTHMNVGFPDHPLQMHFPSVKASVQIENGSFIGVNSTILNGVSLGEKTFVAAGAVVTKSFSGGCVIGGVPAKKIRSL